jgi:hypothetical protein
MSGCVGSATAQETSSAECSQWTDYGFETSKATGFQTKILRSVRRFRQFELNCWALGGTSPATSSSSAGTRRPNLIGGKEARNACCPWSTGRASTPTPCLCRDGQVQAYQYRISATSAAAMRQSFVPDLCEFLASRAWRPASDTSALIKSSRDNRLFVEAIEYKTLPPSEPWRYGAPCGPAPTSASD